MIKDQNTTVAYHCPFCGMSILQPVTMFSMNGNLIKLKCVCGGSELIIHITKDKKVRITVPCIVCPNSHSFTVSSNIFFERDLFAFSCTFTSIDICFIGKYSKVYNAIKKNEEELLKAFAEYESDYYPDTKNNNDNPGFTAAFHGDDGVNNNYKDYKDYNHGKSGIDLFNPFENFEYPEDLDEFNEDDFWNLWDDDGQFGDNDDIYDTGDTSDIYFPENMYDKPDKSDKSVKKDKATGFELYRPSDFDSPKKKTKSSRNNSPNKSNKTNKTDTTGKSSKNVENVENVENTFKFVEIDENDFSKIKIRTYPIILQILDVVSGLYKENKIYCKCGHFDGKIALWENCVHIECKNCGSQRDIKSATIADIEYIAELGELYLDFD